MTRSDVQARDLRIFTAAHTLYPRPIFRRRTLTLISHRDKARMQRVQSMCEAALSALDTYRMLFVGNQYAK